jgi:hypothetical protein
MLCVLAGGAGLVVGGAYKLVSWITVGQLQADSPVLPDLGFLSSLKLGGVVSGCLILLAVGVALLVSGKPAGAKRWSNGKGPFGWSMAVALIITLAGLSVFLYRNFQVFGHRHYTAGYGHIGTVPRKQLIPDEVNPPESLPVQLGEVERRDFPKYDYKLPYKFSEDWFSRCIPLWEEALKPFKGEPDIHYLEVGVFEGRSALWVLENVCTHPSSRITGIDPGIETRAHKTLLSNIKLSGQEQRFSLIKGFSQFELRKLPVGSFDIIYIDGDHRPKAVIEDSILAWRLLKPGGLVIFDDYLKFQGEEGPKIAIDSFYHFFHEEFEVIHCGYQVILRKKEGGS